MAFLVEDGTGLAASNSYLSIADYKTYWTDRGVTIGESDAEIQAALIRSSDYVDFNNNFIGTKSLSTQNMEWPRYNAYDQLGVAYSGVPSDLEKAIAEYTAREIASTTTTDSTLSPDPTYDATGGKLILKRSKAEGLESEKEYSESHGTTTMRAYPAADKYLKHLTISGRQTLRA